MKLYSVIQIGEYHINHCEDFLYIGEIGNRKMICAVMDGCTNGTESFFASALVGKLLRKIIKGYNYKEFYEIKDFTKTNDDYIKSILNDLVTELKIAKNQLMLEQNELLTTLIIFVLDKNDKNGVVLVVGDGLICINGQITEFDQQDKPDYVGYHLNENFETWYNNQKQKIHFENINDISISTDGILMFKQVVKSNSTDKIDPIHFLIIDTSNLEKENMLELKMKELESVFGYKPTDDLALIRLINN